MNAQQRAAAERDRDVHPDQLNEQQVRHRLILVTEAGQVLEAAHQAAQALLLEYAGGRDQARRHPVQRMIVHCQANNDHAHDAVLGMLRAKYDKHCYLCAGRGHWADKCPLGKEIDRSFRNSPFMYTWRQTRGIVYQPPNPPN